MYEFCGVRVDCDAELLRRDGQTITLRPKTWAVLRHLLQHPQRLVTKHELFAAVWGNVAVTEAVLNKSVAELRQAFGDDTRKPRIIQTVARRGFRFVAELHEQPPAPTAVAVAAPPSALLVGRERELQNLNDDWQRACAGQRRMVWITGEAGIGKTTVVDAFLASLPASDVAVGRGQCIEAYGQHEAYMPVLEALQRLVRTRPEMIDVLWRLAPSWLLQMPSLLQDEALQRLRDSNRNPFSPCLLRELLIVFEELSRAQPIALVLEDVQWSDHGTADLLLALAQRYEPARLLVLATLRVADAFVADHRILSVRTELMRRGVARECALELLDHAAVEKYLAARFKAHQFPKSLALWVQQQTDGNAFFMVAAVDHLVAQRQLVQRDASWQLAGAVEAFAETVPDNISIVIERQLAGLGGDQQRALEAASVMSEVIAVPALAAALESDVLSTEAACTTLARSGQFLSVAGETVWPDGTPAAQFKFRHALYRKVLYNRIAIARRRQLHQRIGQRLETAYARQIGVVEAELAVHFENSGDVDRAVRYLQDAAARALQRGAAGEAMHTLQCGLALLGTAETRARLEEKLSLQIALAAAMHMHRGYVDRQTEALFTEAYRLAEQLGATGHRVRAMIGMCIARGTRGAWPEALQIAEDLLTLANQQQLPAVCLMASTIMGNIHCAMGRIESGRKILEAAVASDASPLPFARPDAKVLAYSLLAMPSTLAGLIQQARQASQIAIERARQSSPYDEAFALGLSASRSALILDVDAAESDGRRAAEIAAEHGFELLRSRAEIIVAFTRGWRGGAPQCIAEIETGIAEHDRRGIVMERSFLSVLLVTLLLRAQRAEAALAESESALRLAEAMEQRPMQPELQRLHGEALVLRAQQRPKRSAAVAESERAAAERDFAAALALARQQGSRWFELRAIASLLRLRHAQRGNELLAAELAQLCAQFSECETLPDLLSARQALAGSRAESKRPAVAGG